MLVQRQQFRVKQGGMNEAVEVLQEMWKLIDPIPHRIYKRITGPSNTVYQELDFEDWAHREQWWADTMPKVAPLMDKWRAVSKGEGSTEFLDLVE